MPLSPQHLRPAHISVNPSAIPTLHSNTPRTNLNNPEQIRTNPNIAKPPDQIGTPPESPPNTPKKTKPEHRHRHPLSVIPAPHSSFLRRQEPTSPHLPSPFPNSSLPPSRGEVRWGVRGNARLPTALAYTPIAPPTIPAPLPSFPRPLRHTSAPPVIPAPLPSFLRPSVIPAQAGTHLAPPPLPSPFPNSSLPPSRGEVRWGVRGNARLPTALAYTPIAPPVIPAPLPSFLRPSVIPAPLPSFLRPSVIPAPLRHSCAGRNPPRPTSPPPPPSPIHPSPLPGGRLGGGCEATRVCQPLSPTPRSPLPPFPPTLHRRHPPSTVATHSPSFPRPLRHSRAPSRHSCAGRNPADLSPWCAPHHPGTSSVNPRCHPPDTPRTTLNKSEQTRTPPDAPTR